ncbi:MAG: aminotransferase class V-fold PLP-dependent enzyme [Candidatus Brocadiales bacterium]|nr:aminotransferase class V-fold PLP-dependent enzyme [Candidatus Bathyanammoxibius amoris]
MIYLDNAATSFPKPEQVYLATDEFFRHRAANPGRAGYRLSMEAEREVEGARKLLADLFGVKEPERLVFTLNATDAINMALKGLLKEGDHVITSNLEHNSVTRPLYGLEKRGIISVTRVEASAEGVIDPGAVKEAILPQTRLIVITHASNVLGTIQPIKAIGRLAREKGLIVMIDAAQSAGVWPINVADDAVDLLAFTGHKGLLGPPGTGGLYVGERVEISAWREGGTGFDSESPIHPGELPFRLEGGTPNFLGIVGLKAGVEFIGETGIDNIMRHGQELLTQILNGLEGNDGFILYGPGGSKDRLPIAALNIKNLEPSVTGGILDETYGIAARSGLHCAPFIHRYIGSFPQGAVRISPGYFNTKDDIVQLLSALKEISSSAKTTVQ